jgi:hypothetical protein
MNSALLHNGKVVTAVEYNPASNGSRIYCLDKSCKTSLIYVPGTETSVPYFKTTGKNQESKHQTNCGFYKTLNFEESIQKVWEYQLDLLGQGLKETIIRLNLSKIDPDYESKQMEREESEKKVKNPNEIKVKQENATPNSIGSLKAIVKLLTSYEPDTLATILISVKGKKIPLSEIVLSHERAHELLWSGQLIDSLCYFVYGTIDQVFRREKVYFINFKPVNGVVFSLIVFDKYFKHFTYTDEQLIGKNVLAWGGLIRNSFQEKNTSEMIIKANDYIAYLPKG